MSCFFQTVSNKYRSRKGSESVTEEQLHQWGLTGIHLHPYQLEGVNWMISCYETGHGCILGDEMGLGKTCQTICLLLCLSGKLHRRPFVIICPLSVLNNWRDELKRFSPSLSTVIYSGGKEERAELQQDLKSNHGFHILLITYEMCLKDATFLKRFNWTCLVVDEAQRLKNQDSLFHKTLSEYSTDFRLLLTGTPIQNNLQELYSMLAFIEPVIFPKELANEFVSYYHEIEKDTEKVKELHSLLQPLLLRRVKAEVSEEIPKKVEVVLYHGMSALQKKLYKALLVKDLDAFENESGKKANLQNVLIQLRKCVAHPYLFIGVEPEPFVIGDHLIEASGKLNLLDKLLSFLYDGKHRVLLFSQMTQMLDILQDYMEYRGYSYERLDGSVRGEERHLAINNFAQQPIFVFLLSTKAGHMYIFEGKDYSKETSQGDKKAYDHLLEDQKTLLEDLSQGGRILRNKENVLLMTADMGPSKKRPKLSPEELEVRQKKLQEAAIKRARLREEKRQRAAEAKQQKKLALWEANRYQSCCLESEESSEEEDKEEETSLLDLEYTDPEQTSIKYIMGDVTHPIVGDGDAIIVHCVDDSGHWGKGGLFTALANRSDQPKKIYELAGKMKDLTLGGTLLFCIDDKESRNKGTDLLALIVAQHRDNSNNLSGIKLPALEKGLKKIYQEAKKRNASIHLPRIGYSTKGFNWYGTERLIRKYLGSRGIPTFVYYFPRSKASSSSK
ncbi:chromodomain-helicase-DNA-binding protein 1-like isoform X3 [Erythrolamprus reginae]|uniref:chromodomain-helicase-DNA-binding protein 1-like isoform X3 n=1 Tax=Erythrolamprus reginae TaxID=121349 RepID=UPI00396CDA37